MSFTIFQNKKTPFQAIKIRTSKSQKIDIFPKGLTHGFSPKMALFRSFFFWAIQARKMSFTILYIEKTPLQPIKKVQKVEKLTFFQRGQLTIGFGPKMALFPTFFIQAIQARKISFMIFYIEKTPLQPIKAKRSKSRKTHIFPKGLTHSLGPKLANFTNFFFQAIQARKMSFTIF